MKPVVVMLALGGLGIGAFAYAKSAEKKKKVSAALDLGLGEVSGCEYTENQLKSFTQISGFTIYWFNKADADKRAAELGVDSWVKVPPKPEIASNPMARVFNDDACHFIMWNGVRWVPDNVTQAAFVLWTKGPQAVPPGTLPVPPGSGLPDTPPMPFPFPLPAPPGIPPGYITTTRGPGLHGEMGTAYWYATGDVWFQPDDLTLAPYHPIGLNADFPKPPGF